MCFVCVFLISLAHPEHVVGSNFVRLKKWVSNRRVDGNLIDRKHGEREVGWHATKMPSWN